jgi:DNA repair exonuclease SbcCD ATPase subunit
VSTPTKWRLDAVRSFRGIDRQLTFELAGKPGLFWGNNGVGKSTIALALQWTLFGRFPDGVLANQRFKQFLPPVGTSLARPAARFRFVVVRKDS